MTTEANPIRTGGRVPGDGPGSARADYPNHAGPSHADRPGNSAGSAAGTPAVPRPGSGQASRIAPPRIASDLHRSDGSALDPAPGALGTVRSRPASDPLGTGSGRASGDADPGSPDRDPGPAGISARIGSRSLIPDPDPALADPGAGRIADPDPRSEPAGTRSGRHPDRDQRRRPQAPAAPIRDADPGSEIGSPAFDGRLPRGYGFAFAVLVMGALAAGVVAFLFSFGNVKALAAQLGVEDWIQPLIAPGIDISVIVLVIGLQWLHLANAPKHLIRGANYWLIGAGFAMLAANVAPSLIMAMTTTYNGPMLPPPETGQLALTQLTQGQLVGRAVLEALAPLGLIGWSHFGPKLVRAFAVVKARAEHAQLLQAEARTFATETDRAEAAAALEAAVAARADAEQQHAHALQAIQEMIEAAEKQAAAIRREAEQLAEQQQQAAARASRVLDNADQEIADRAAEATRRERADLLRQLDGARAAQERADRRARDAEQAIAEAKNEAAQAKAEAQQVLAAAELAEQKARDESAAAAELWRQLQQQSSATPPPAVSAAPRLRSVGDARPAQNGMSFEDRITKIKEAFPGTWWLSGDVGGPKQRDITSLLGCGAGTASKLMARLAEEHAAQNRQPQTASA